MRQSREEPQKRGPANILQAGQVGRQIQRAEADRFAANMLPMIRSIQSVGPIRMVAIAKKLKGRGLERRGACSGTCLQLPTFSRVRMNPMRFASAFYRREIHTDCVRTYCIRAIC